MSLELAAQHLASRGRKGDSMLVHMAPEEVSGLQALARAGGGTLTLNPDTGLPEANFLKRMLPMIIGAGLAAATGGTSLALTPGMIGLGLGGVETLRTGSLSKGLMAGLGAYGGAGLAGSFMGAGAAGAAGAGAGTTGAVGAGAGVPSASYNLLPQSQYAIPAPAGVGEGLRMGASEGLRAGASNLTTDVGGSLAKISTPPVTPMPPTLGERFASGLGNLGTKDIKYGLAALSPTLQPDEATPYVGGGANYEYTYDPNTSSYTRVPVGTRDKMGRTPSYYAVGGPIEEMSDRNQMETMMANGGQMFARGGVSHLGDYSDGGRLLKGPGDGVSDSIPATIADKRPARLADGEFVVPARIVSELGNGSTEAGARKLYAMMDRVQKARGKTTGKDRVAVNSRAEKLLPA
jgi:hypothetical protein